MTRVLEKANHRDLGGNITDMAFRMSYFTAEFAAWFVPPAGVLVAPGPAGGRLVWLTKEPFDQSNPAHEAAADAMYRTLAAAFERLPRFSTAQVQTARTMLGWA